MGLSQPTPAESLRAALWQLVQSAKYALECNADRWQFAVELSQLLANGATLMDVRWLIHSGYAQHAKETTIPGDAARSFRPLAPTAFPSDTCLVLTDRGVTELAPLFRFADCHANGPAAAGTPHVAERPLPLPLGEGWGEGASARASAEMDQQVATKNFSSPQPHPNHTQIAPAAAHVPAESLPPAKPEWDADRRELRYQGQVIKRFRVPAANQELILTAFQEENWPHCIDDPLPPDGETDSKQRLQATIKSLSRSQHVKLIHFHGNGNGLQVYWEALRSDQLCAPSFEK